MTHSPTETHLWLSAARKLDLFCPLPDGSRVGPSALEPQRSPQSLCMFSEDRVTLPPFFHASAELCSCHLLLSRVFLSPWVNITALWLRNICLDWSQTGVLVSGRDFRSTTQLSCSSRVCCAIWNLDFGINCTVLINRGNLSGRKTQKNNFVVVLGANE